jgi:hypothetical protein
MEEREDRVRNQPRRKWRKAGVFLKLSRREVTWIGWGLGILIALGIRRIP